MTLEDFKKIYDKPGSIVLIEGKRKVKETEKESLVQLGKILAEQTKHITFRSGNAAGSDELFSRGVCRVDPSRLMVITPYTGHRQKKNIANQSISLDDINLEKEDEVLYYSKKNKKTKHLIDKYVKGERGRYAIKAAYIIRDTIKVIGTGKIKPVSLGIFYDDLNEPMSGGTGHTMDICLKNNIPVINQLKWMKWLNNTTQH
ncbi:MAG TPA: hypothetical protein ENI82_01855 [Bacteroidetes bacterium]|nr:hypothetical protein [Bacteroidota bacterium]